MCRVLILADDLTGAADCGVAFVRSGLGTVVVLGDVGSLDSEVVSVDCDTRGLDPQRAADKTELLLRKYSRETQIVFKKVDSTLRGNVAEELAVVLRERRSLVPHAIVIFAPAFPTYGRTTVSGTQLLNGKPLEESEVWREVNRQSSFTPDMLCKSGLRSELIPLQTVRSGHGNLRSSMKELSETTDVLVCDAETDPDLSAIAGAAASLGTRTVWAGSAGLAYQLPKACGIATPSTGTAMELAAFGPTLFVVGSPVQRAHEQAGLLAASGITGLTIHANDLLTNSVETYQHQIKESLRTSRDVLVRLGSIEDNPTRSRSVCRRLADMLAPHADSIGALVVTGGETARSILDAWGVRALRLLQEVEPGVPFCVTENWRRQLPVITKAGSFGSPQTLLHCRDFINEVGRTSAQGKEL